MSVNWTFLNFNFSTDCPLLPDRSLSSNRSLSTNRSLSIDKLSLSSYWSISLGLFISSDRSNYVRTVGFIPSDGSLWNVQNSLKPDFWEVRLLILIPVTILIFPYSELIWKNLLRNTCAHHWIFIWRHIVREERNHVSDAIHLILNEKLGVLQNVFPTNSWSMTNVASQTSGKFVTKVNLTFVTFSLSNRLCHKVFVT